MIESGNVFEVLVAAVRHCSLGQIGSAALPRNSGNRASSPDRAGESGSKDSNADGGAIAGPVPGAVANFLPRALTKMLGVGVRLPEGLNDSD